MKCDQKRLFTACGILALLAGPAFGHAADQGFVLLLPTTAYITGGTIVVVATILFLFLLRSGQLARLFAPVEIRIDRQWFLPGQLISLFASLVLAFLIYVGLTGPTDPQANLLPLTLWTVWWMAMFVIQGFLFDIWRWVNPWVGILQLVLPDHKAPFRMPVWLSVWPALCIFIGFQGFVLADVAPNDPDRLALFAIGYWVFTLLGMALFGRDLWLRQAECFTVLFNLIGLMRIGSADQLLRYGFPGWQILDQRGFDTSHAIFVLVILGAGSFDGLHETFWWLAQLGINPLEYPGRSAMVYKTSIGLVGAILLLIAIFAAVVWFGLLLIARDEERRSIRFRDAFVQFSMTLLPIAIGYHFAHYLVTFLVQIQVVVANLADPLARGWNLFGLGDTRVLVGFLTVPQTVKVIWLTQAGIVVISHVLAVLLSHRTAELLCQRQGNIVRIQIGLSLLMVVYTIFGLWLLASPRGV